MLRSSFDKRRRSISRMVFERIWLVPNAHSKDGVSQQKPMLPIPESEEVIKPIRIGVLQHQRPSPASIGRLIQPALVARPGGHDDSRFCIPGLHAAKVEGYAVGRCVGNGALRPVRAAVNGLEYRPARPAGPGDCAVHRIDPAQAGGRVRFLHLPGIGCRGGGLGCGEE